MKMYLVKFKEYDENVDEVLIVCSTLEKAKEYCQKRLPQIFPDIIDKVLIWDSLEFEWRSKCIANPRRASKTCYTFTIEIIELDKEI